LPQLVASSKFLLCALSFLPNEEAIRKQKGTDEEIELRIVKKDGIQASITKQFFSSYGLSNEIATYFTELSNCKGRLGQYGTYLKVNNFND
jgi:hypothetical protein